MQQQMVGRQDDFTADPEQMADSNKKILNSEINK
jgi:hypothetical protein